MLAHDAVTQFVARRDDGSIVGVATLVDLPDPDGHPGWVEDVIVDEASNNQGIGRLLLDAMVDASRELGCKTVDLTSRPSRRRPTTSTARPASRSATRTSTAASPEGQLARAAAELR